MSLDLASLAHVPDDLWIDTVIGEIEEQAHALEPIRTPKAVVMAYPMRDELKKRWQRSRPYVVITDGQDASIMGLRLYFVRHWDARRRVLFDLEEYRLRTIERDAQTSTFSGILLRSRSLAATVLEPGV